jgi:hypothetical protein
LHRNNKDDLPLREARRRMPRSFLRWRESGRRSLTVSHDCLLNAGSPAFATMVRDQEATFSRAAALTIWQYQCRAAGRDETFRPANEAIFALPRKLPEIEVLQHVRLVNSLRLAGPAAGPSLNWRCHARRKVHAAFGNDPEPGRARPGLFQWRPEGNQHLAARAG